MWSFRKKHFGQHLLTSLLTKISRDINTTNKFEDMEFSGMSSYGKYFVGIWKYGSSALKRTIDHVSMTSSYVSTLWNIYAQKSLKNVLFQQIRMSIYMMYKKTPARGRVKKKILKCRNITRCHRNMVDSAFESWRSILSDPKKILVIRTHPEELHVL